jgi:hypothetical protein
MRIERWQATNLSATSAANSLSTFWADRLRIFYLSTIEAAERISNAFHSVFINLSSDMLFGH